MTEVPTKDEGMTVLDPALLSAWQGAVSDDPELSVVGRFFTADVLLASGDRRFLVRFNEGVLRDFVEGPHPTQSWDFAIKAEPNVWARFLQDPPPAEYHDIWAAAWLGHMVLEGNMKVFMQNHYAFWRALKLLRIQANASVAA
jgi:hypothetical protein